MRNANLLNTSLKDARVENAIYNFNTQPFNWYPSEEKKYLICDREKDEKDIKNECKSLQLNQADLQEVESEQYLFTKSESRSR